MVRKNKSKKEIVSDIQLVQDADRRRALIRDIIFPYLIETGETIGYSKIFLQAFSGLVNGVFDDTRKTTTIGHLIPKLIEKLNGIFKIKDLEQKKEYDRYLKFINMLEHISIQDLTYAAELPRYIDGYNTKNVDKGLISSISIDEILGK